MQVELVISRGLGIVIDGQAPTAPHWGYSDNEDGTGYDLDVQIGPHRVTGITFDKPMEYQDSPTKLTLTTAEGTHELTIRKCLTGSEDGPEGEDGDPDANSGDIEVILGDGTTRTIDSYMLYVLATD